MENLGNYRKSYEKKELLENSIPNNPIELFGKWFREVEDFGGVEEVNAMTVSTIGLDGFPKSRVVLLKQFDENGFVFYTNYNSEKGKSILENPNVCLSFFWPNLERQVIVKGIAEKTSDSVSDTYFNSRPKGSQLGAIASNQSEVIGSRSVLENALAQLEKDFENSEIERPDFWGGFLIRPISLEFWQGRANRLHDRIRFEIQENKAWKIDRLSP